jgi:glutaredoxin
MKKVTLFVMAGCPYCRQAQKWMQELMEEHPEYRDVPMEVIDEVQQPEVANSWDYYYVPTYFVEKDKLHEGAATKQKIQRVFEAALKN